MIKNDMKRIVLSVLIALTLGGCMWGRMKVNDDTIVDRAGLIKVGSTKGAQVPAILGAQPTMRMPGKSHAVLGYTYADTKSSGLMLILFNFTRSTTVADTLYVETDAESDLVTRVYIPPKRKIEWRFWPFGEE